MYTLPRNRKIAIRKVDSALHKLALKLGFRSESTSLRDIKIAVYLQENIIGHYFSTMVFNTVGSCEATAFYANNYPLLSVSLLPGQLAVTQDGEIKIYINQFTDCPDTLATLDVASDALLDDHKWQIGYEMAMQALPVTYSLFCALIKREQDMFKKK